MEEEEEEEGSSMYLYRQNEVLSALTLPMPKEPDCP